MTKKKPKRAAKPRRPAAPKAEGAQAQRAIYRISEAAQESPSLNDLFREIHGIVNELMPAKNFYVALYDAATDTISFPYFVDEFDPPMSPKKPGRGLTEYVLRTGSSLLVDEALHQEMRRRGDAVLVGAPSFQWLGVPLKTGSTTMGVLVVQTYATGVRYTQADERMLAFVSTQIAMAVGRKQAEERLQAQQRFLRQVLDASPNPIFVKDWDGRYVLVNQAVADIYGTTIDALIGKCDADFNNNREEVARLLADDREVLTSQRAKVIPEETVTNSRTGAVHYFQTVKVPLVSEAGTAPQVLGVSAEITERKALETRLLQGQKMEAVGRLAGGIAHDFNNLLTAMLGSASLLFDIVGPNHPATEDAETIRQAALRAAELTRQLLAFSRRQVLAPRVLDVNAVVGEVEKILRRLIGENIALRIALGPDLEAVRADPAQLEQVIVNLVVNARDAMPRGGTLTIETANVELDGNYAQEHVVVQPGHYVLLAVTDTGTGMDRDTQARIFEPFFTTKEQGKGTGLGLSSAYGTVKQSGGYIWVYSELGRGTTFKIYLPRERAISDTPPAAAPPAPGGAETVFIVEDQPEVRRLARKSLETRGYTVLEAGSGDEALRLSERYVGPIHLLVTDVIMPGLSGREVALLLTTTRPEMRVLYVSGYPDESIVHHGVLDPGLAFLQKPFTPNTLARKVRQVLDGPDEERTPLTGAG